MTVTTSGSPSPFMSARAVYCGGLAAFCGGGSTIGIPLTGALTLNGWRWLTFEPEDKSFAVKKMLLLASTASKRPSPSMSTTRLISGKCVVKDNPHAHPTVGPLAGNGTQGYRPTYPS